MTFTPRAIAGRTLHRRAIEAAIWGMAAVNYDAMYQALVRDAHGASNQIVYWSRLLDWKNQTLTPNPDTIYLMPFYRHHRRTDGPRNSACRRRVRSPAPSTTPGSARSRTSARPASTPGKGGKYLILPPELRGPVPDGYLAMPSTTYCTFALLRSNLNGGSDDDVAPRSPTASGPALSAGTGDNAPPTTFVDAADVVFDATIPYDARFFEALDRRVQAEPGSPATRQ